MARLATLYRRPTGALRLVAEPPSVLYHRGSVLGLRDAVERALGLRHAHGDGQDDEPAAVLSLGCPRAAARLSLLPLILVSYWASMRIQWRPLLVALPLQIILALSFAALAYPAMILGEFTVADHAWHEQLAEHGHNPFADPMVMSLWLASFVSFLPTYGFGLALVTGSCAVFAISQVRAVSARRSSASGAPRAWRRCACSSRPTRYSTCCTPSAATSNGIRRARSPWWCSSRTCCAAC